MKRILFAALTAAALFSDGILQSLNAQNMEIPKKVSPFPVGDKLPEQFSKYFIGQAWLAPLTDDKRLNAPVSNVTFSPGCRNNWHSHTGGQLLIAVGGRGYYQEKGRPARALLPGDIVEIAPDVVHWHGAAPDSWFSHLAVACNPATNENTWLEPVDDAQYAAATASVPSPASRLGEDARRRLAELFPGGIPELGDADPELFEIFGNFALGEVTAYGQLDTRTRMLCILASNIASQGRTAYRTTLEGALNAGVTPVEVKETLYQAVPYVGMAKVADFVGITNEVLEARGVTLPLAGQSTTSPAARSDLRPGAGACLQSYKEADGVYHCEIVFKTDSCCPPVFAAPEGVTGKELEMLYDRFANGDDFSFVEKEWEPLMAVEYRHRHNVMWFIFLFIALVIAAMAAYQHGWIE